MNATSMLNALPGPLSDAALRVSAGAGPLGALFARATMRYSADAVPSIPSPSALPVRVAIGPVDEVHQAALWARSLRASDADMAVTPFVVGSGTASDGDDVFRVPRSVSILSTAWQREFSAFLASQTHVINESARPMLGRFKDVDAFAELSWLRDQGAETAMIFHGSDIRDPQGHIDRERWSPFHDPRVPRRLLTRRSARTRRAAIASGMPLFVTTPDLLTDLPTARWCPVVIDESRWYRKSGEAEVPLVVHAPSSGPMKGTSHVTGPMRKLEAEGLIRYREVSGVPAAEMPDVYADADIVLDQFLIGSYGVAACEAMASGSVVVAHVDAGVRHFIRDASGLSLPIVEATPTSLEEVVRALVADDGRRGALADESVAFVRAVHDGSFSAAALTTFLRG